MWLSLIFDVGYYSKGSISDERLTVVSPPCGRSIPLVSLIHVSNVLMNNKEEMSEEVQKVDILQTNP